MPKNLLRNTIYISLFAIPFVPFLISSQLFFPFITSKAFVWRILVEVAFAAYILLKLADSEIRVKKTYLLYNLLAFLGVILLADFVGAAPLKSFWSNFERMEGFITMIHLGAFFIVAGSVFKEVDWRKWWNTNLLASAIMVGYALFQVLGAIKPSQSDARVDGTFGNAIYLAVYMLFNIFIALFLSAREWKNKGWRWLYGILIFFQIFILYYTATRGAILGLLGGLIILAILNLWNKEAPGIKKLSVGILVIVAVIVGVFFGIRNTQFVAKSPVLSRFASLSTTEIKTQGRYFIWPIALKGIKEHPLLGWGQDNFNYIFQKYYTPDMYILEPWFDRAHNIFLDWGVAGGVLGLLLYLSFYALALYAIWWRDRNFSFVERSILTSLLAAYFFHNFFVFDHLLSYVLFFSLLAYLHSREQVESEVLVKTGSQEVMIAPFVAIVAVLLVVVYYVNYKPLKGNVELINALEDIQTGKQAEAITAFEDAYHQSYLGHEEIVEQLTIHSPEILQSKISDDDKKKFYQFVRDAATKLAAEYPNDARYQMMTGSFLSTTGDASSSLSYLEKAKVLAPNKQQVYFELGSAYFNVGRVSDGLAAFKKVYDETPNYPDAKTVYLIGAIYAGDRNLETELLKLTDENTLVFDTRIISAYYAKGRVNEVLAILNRRIQLDPANKTTYQDYINQILSQIKK